ncbi:hypothetical protein [Desulfosporosinus sp. HMP52]|nr:hypothetical protein [Desulfosporosinus sp. HMP52]
MKLLRKLLLRSDRFRRALSDYQRRMKQGPERDLQVKPNRNVLTLIISR